MKVTPMRKYARPDYPDRGILDRHPELLRLVPKRWQGNALVIGALTLMCAVSLCGRKIMATENPNATVPRIAPIFSHGEGRAAFGCVIVNPPVFLSEDEARHVIIEEGTRSGLRFSQDIKAPKQISVPITSLRDSISGGSSIMGSRQEHFSIDGWDGKHKVGFEFVSAANYNAWLGSEDAGGSIQRWNILGAAQSLRSGLAQAKLPGTYAVFYDPCARRDHYSASPAAGSPKPAGSQWDFDAERAMAKAQARAELRKQAIDFIKWLKVQGVI